jgi:hypothetical protein
MAQQESVFARDGYLHQSPAGSLVVGASGAILFFSED